MAREIKNLKSSVIEDMVVNNLSKICDNKLENEKLQLFLRLIISDIAYHFFLNPDTQIDVGFMRFRKSPNLDELFTVDIIRNEDIINAQSLYKYYRGELISEKELKGIVEGFVGELLMYSQQQNTKITSLTGKLSGTKKLQKKAKKEN